MEDKVDKTQSYLSCFPAPNTPPDPSARPALASLANMLFINVSKASLTLKFSFAYLTTQRIDY